MWLHWGDSAGFPVAEPVVVVGLVVVGLAAVGLVVVGLVVIGPVVVGPVVVGPVLSVESTGTRLAGLIGTQPVELLVLLCFSAIFPAAGSDIAVVSAGFHL